MKLKKNNLLSIKNKLKHLRNYNPTCVIYNDKL